MKPLAGTILLAAVCVCFTLLVLGLPAAHAYDDNIDTNSSQSQTVNSQQILSLINQLAKQSNDTQGLPIANNAEYQRLLSQLNESVASGNANETASNLLQLQNFTSSSSATPGILSSLVNSIQATGNGITVNPNSLASLLSVGPDGLPNGLGPGSTGQKIGDLSSLASLLQNTDPQLAQQFLNMANNLSLDSGIPLPSGSPSFGNGLSAPLRGLQAPTIAPVRLAGPGSLVSVLEQLMVPALVGVAALALFVMRGRIAGMLKGQRNPGEIEEKVEPMDYDPADPKKRILYYFSKAIEQMKKRGVPKAAAETHREFSDRCEGRPGSQQVRVIGVFYEKAKFSGQSVTDEEAEKARIELSNLETVHEG